MDAKNVEKLAHYAISIALIYIVIGLIGGFGMSYLKETEDTLKDYVVSAHSHFLCMSILILVIGLAMSNWTRDLETGKYTLTGGQLRSAQASVILLTLGAILAYIFHLMDSEVMAIGYILFFIGFLMTTIGWIMGIKQTK